MMSRGAAIRIEGGREVAVALRRAATQGLDEQLAGTKREVERIVVGAAEMLVPRRTGALAGSIRGVTEAGDRQIWPTVAAGTKGSDVPYAGPVHFGWPTRGLHRADDDTFEAARQAVASGAAGLGFGNKSLNKIARRRASVASGRSSKGLARGGPIKPNPFLYRAADRRQGEVLAVYEDSLNTLANSLSKEN